MKRMEFWAACKENKINEGMNSEHFCVLHVLGFLNRDDFLANISIV